MKHSTADGIPIRGADRRRLASGVYPASQNYREEEKEGWAPEGARFQFKSVSHSELGLNVSVEHPNEHADVDDEVEDTDDQGDDEPDAVAAEHAQQSRDDADDEDDDEDDPHDLVEGGDVAVGDLLVDPEDDDTDDQIDDSGNDASSDVVESEGPDDVEDTDNNGGVSDNVDELGQDSEFGGGVLAGGDFELVDDLVVDLLSTANLLSEGEVDNGSDELSDSEDNPANNLVVHVVIDECSDEEDDGCDDLEDTDSPYCRSYGFSVVKE